MLKLYDLTTEYKREPLGLDEAQPRFGWKLDSDQQDTVQASYRLRIVQGGDVVWDSGTVASTQSVLNEYLGPNLTPRTEYDWTVTVWDNHGETAEGTSRFETGLLNGSAFEGKAQWITHCALPGTEYHSAAVCLHKNRPDGRGRGKDYKPG